MFSGLLSVELNLQLEPWLRGSHGALACVFSFPQTEQVERNYIKEKKAAVKEFEDKKVELKENLIAELEEKKKMIENEKLTMELTGGMKAPQSRVPGALGGTTSLLPQFLVRAEPAGRRVGFDTKAQSSSSVWYWLCDFGQATEHL